MLTLKIQPRDAKTNEPVGMPVENEFSEILRLIGLQITKGEYDGVIRLNPRREENGELKFPLDFKTEIWWRLE